MCACTEPVGTGIGAACVERGRPKWRITMLNYKYTIKLIVKSRQCFNRGLGKKKKREISRACEGIFDAGR